jgi:transposase
MAREARRITLSNAERDRLQRLAKARLAPQGLAFRARVILRCAQADKPTNLVVAAELRCDPDTVARWRNRFVRRRLDGLRDLPRSGRPRAFSPEDRHQVVVLATTKPADVGVPVSHWSLDDLALKIVNDAHYRDMARSTVQRILAEADLKPHKCRSWLHSVDPAFEEKALAICKLYLAAPRLYQHGELVLCCDEKTGIQALERKYPSKPMRPGQPERQEFEYVRHGTRCLLATFVVPTGWVFGDVTVRRTNQDFRRHIRHTVAWLATHSPQAKKFHWVMDNLNTHWSLEVCALFARLNGIKYEPKKLKRGRQRIAFLTDEAHRHVIHYTPKHGSWLNQVEIWFSVLARRVLRRGNFTSKADLARKILAYIAYYNTYKAHPYAWTYTGKPLVGEAKSKRRSRDDHWLTLNP